jgi:putative ATP-dependent endonuclease of the OLD family
MRIKSTRFRNFRCLRDVTVDFDQVTTLIGPNGAGKSSVLRALDWYFNSEPARLSEEDIYSGADLDDRTIEVEVVFTDLTDRDREALGPKYAPTGATTFTAWRTWSVDGGDKTTGKARAYPPFEEIRGKSGATDKKLAYGVLAAAEPDLDLPKWTKVDDALAAMTVWERDHPDRLEDALVGDSHFFGFNGRNVLSGLFDFVLVTADMRAREESLDVKKTVIGRILEMAVNRDSANAEFAELADEVSRRQADITARHLGDQLTDLGKALTAEVGAFTSGREVILRATSPDVHPSPATISVSIADSLLETSVERQGHGFQRALLISSLKLLANRGAADNDGSVILLAIEEPELFQHPMQARVFAKVLRDLAAAPDAVMQVAYATHSPFFVDARFFDQVRRVTRRRSTGIGHPDVKVHSASLDAVAKRLTGTGLTDKAIRSRWEQVCTKNLAEALFADTVVLVEGEDDKGIIDGIAARNGQRQLELDGITVAYAGGKQHLFTPHAILGELDIPTLVIFDNDKGCGIRLCSNGKANEAATADANERTTNRRVLAYLGLPEEDYPEGQLCPTVHAWADRLEEVLAADWPAWEATRLQIVNDLRGVLGKNSATYALAARECPDEPTGALTAVIDAARALAVR